MAVQEQTPLQEYTANGIAKQFDLEFDCESADHLIVSIDDLEVLHTDWYLSGNAVAFYTAPANGKQIKIQRNTPFNRLADYQSYNNSFRPPAINKDLDRIWWKLQELGVADWILSNRISALKAYVDDRDDELRAYLMEEIRKQGVALDQLDEYYNYLMERLAQIAVDKGWDASFVVDGDQNQKQINAITPITVNSVAALRGLVTPLDGKVAFTKSYHEGLGKGGATYVFDLSKVGVDNGVSIIKGWVLQSDGRVCVTQAGCKLDGVNDDSIAFNACADLDLPMCAKHSGRMRCLSPLRLNTHGFVGSGMFTQIDAVGGHDGIILPLGGGRLFQNIEKFFLLSSDNSAQNHFAIRSQEITNPATQPLGNGFKIRDIEIGGGGRFGCGIALTDCFRTSINDIGMTSCANAIVLYGRVVQCKVGVITSNSDEFEPAGVNSTVLNKLTSLPASIDKTKRYGLLVTGSSHTGSYQYPESIKSRDNAYVKHDYGLYHYDGLFCSYKDIDLDYNLIHGAYFYSCNGLVTLDTCWIAQNEGASHGVVINAATTEAKRLVLKGIHGFAYGDLQVGSALIYQSSDGVSLPARRGVELDGVTLASNHWTRGIDFNRMKDFTIKNFIEEGTAIDKGVSLLNCENFVYSDSISALSNIHTPTGEFEVSRITGSVTYNFLDFSTADKSRPTSTVIQNKPLELQGFGGAWKAPIKFGGGFLWITEAGKLMKKVGAAAPTSNTDGIEII